MKPFQLFIASFLIFFVSISTSVGAEFFRKQEGTTTIANGSSSRTVTITAIDMSKAFLVFSSTVNNASPANFQAGGEITNSTTLTFERNANTGTMSISWQVFEFESGVNVQHGSTTNVTRGAPMNVTINCIDLSKSFVLISARKSGTTLGADDGVTANLTTPTNMELMISNAGPGGADMEEAYWQVIEYQAAIVKKLTTTLSAGSTTTTSTITPSITTLSKAIVISNHWFDGNAVAADFPRTELTNTSTVTYTRVGTTTNMNFVTYVIEFTDQSSVVRGTRNFASTVVSHNVPITATSASGVFGSGNYGRQGSTDFAADDNIGHVWFTYEITSGINLSIQRATGTSGGNSSADAPWQIVTFEDTGLQQNTFYSRLTGPTAWESNTAWSFTPDGSSGAVPSGVYPRRRDNVVIQNGHTIAINNVNDNGPCSQSPDGLGMSPNIGPFTGSGDQMFYHTGDILIANGGTLTSTEEIMIAGYTLVANGGTLTVNEDVINLGYFEIAQTGNFTNTDDLILSGNSITIINNLSFGADDIYIDWTNATLCGEGIMNLGNGGADPTIQFFNGGSLNQVCSTFTVTCTLNCGAFPITPTGSFSSGNSGPGGVGSTTGSGDVRLWLDANTIGQADATNVTTWSDQSGYGNDANAVATFEPVFNTNQQNGFPDVHFTNANSDYLRVADDNSLDPTTVSLFVVGNHSASSTSSAGYLVKFRTSTLDGYQIIRSVGTANTRFRIDGAANFVNSSSGAYATNAILSGVYNKTNLELFQNETSQGTDNYAADITANSNFLYLGTSPNGPGTGVSGFLDGDIAEAVVIGRNVNVAQRIVIDNYLSAKYAVAIANDVYTMDNGGNGDYDYDVAGIGQAADGSNHRDARGTGIVRMWNPSALDNSDFLIWGHDNGGLTNSADVDGTVIEERLTQIWRVSETADAGNVSISFDFNGIGNPLGSNLRLLIDRDDDFTTNDVTPIVGTVSGNKVVFSNINFIDRDRFTLGNTDASSPLPVELLLFEATALGTQVQVEWATASELNNDFFTLQKSNDAEQWNDISIVKGAGTSQNSNHYQVVDYDPIVGVSYYRLKQTDYDGQFEYSPIVSVQMEARNSLLVSPNPSTGVYRITGKQFLPEQIRIYNGLGQKIQTRVSFDNTDTLVDISGLSNGIYIMQVSDGLTLRSVRLLKN